MVGGYIRVWDTNGRNKTGGCPFCNLDIFPKQQKRDRWYSDEFYETSCHRRRHHQKYDHRSVDSCSCFRPIFYSRGGRWLLFLTVVTIFTVVHECVHGQLTEVEFYPQGLIRFDIQFQFHATILIRNEKNESLLLFTSSIFFPLLLSSGKFGWVWSFDNDNDSSRWKK